MHRLKGGKDMRLTSLKEKVLWILVAGGAISIASGVSNAQTVSVSYTPAPTYNFCYDPAAIYSDYYYYYCVNTGYPSSSIYYPGLSYALVTAGVTASLLAAGNQYYYVNINRYPYYPYYPYHPYYPPYNPYHPYHPYYPPYNPYHPYHPYYPPQQRLYQNNLEHEGMHGVTQPESKREVPATRKQGAPPSGEHTSPKNRVYKPQETPDRAAPTKRFGAEPREIPRENFRPRHMNFNTPGSQPMQENREITPFGGRMHTPGGFRNDGGFHGHGGGGDFGAFHGGGGHGGRR